eukprot:symbB.v1.2.038753.t1/scaffold6159.1/size20428/1
MGHASSMEYRALGCCSKQCGGYSELITMVLEPTEPTSDNMDHPTIFDLQGSWYTMDGEHIGEVNGIHVLWLRPPRRPETQCSPPSNTDYL